MSDIGDNSIEAAGKNARQAQGSEPERQTDEHNYDDDNIAGEGQQAEAARVKLAQQAATVDDKSKNKAVELASNLKAIDFLAPMLDTVMLQGKPPEKSYSMVVDLDAEISRKLPYAPQSVKDFYRGTREGQMQHEPIGLALMEKLNAQDAAQYRDRWVEMNAWLAFPEDYIRGENGLPLLWAEKNGPISSRKDKECEEGRQLVQEYLKRKFDRKGAQPLGAEKERDNHLLAKIYSLMLNNHDYLHNEDEITNRHGWDHLPIAFAGIGDNGEAKTFNLRALAEKHMFAVLQNTTKSPLKPDERANLAFVTQRYRQVLPEELRGDARKTERERILKDYVAKYRASDKDLSRASTIIRQGQSIWQTGVDYAKIQYPEMAKIKPGLQLMDSESIYERLTLAEMRQLFIEAHEMRELYGNLGKERSQLAYPDRARLQDLHGRIKAPMREYREGVALEEKLFLSGEPAANAIKKYVQMTPFSKEDLRLKQWQATPNDWQTVYWNDNPNPLETQIQREIVMRFPHSLQCSISNEGAGLVRLWMSGDFVPGNASARLAELGKSLCDANTKKTCVHDSEPRKKPIRNKGF